jgi:tRNA A-37 threonylcarbamoyl transferase component Bud32
MNAERKHVATIETRVCVECGASLPSGVSDVFCPECAFRTALGEGKQQPGEGTLLRWFRQLTTRKEEGKGAVASALPEWRQSPPMAMADPAPGEVIGDYEIIERIGGNMGVVFKARHRLLDKVVALKLVPANLLDDDPARLARFQREMRAMGQLEHPNLVPAADARNVGEWHLVAMEFIDGVDLQQLVRSQRRLSVPVACEVARQAALGLQYAHEHGLIHRDIKPSNLMLTRAGTIKVIDMGLALFKKEATAQLTEKGLLLGTMSYCAPEQFRDAAHVDIRADIYSLGCTLYHLLTGKSPYSERRTFTEIVEAHLHQPFPRLADELPEASAKLEDVLARMTAKDRDSRYSTPKEVVEAMEPFARGAVLAPLVPASLPQSRARGTLGSRALSSPERQRDASPAGRPKARWSRRAALVGLGCALAGGVFLAVNHRRRNSGLPGSNGIASASGPVVPTKDPVVLLMDTTAAGGVYDQVDRDSGVSNTTVIKSALQEYNCLPPRSLHDQPIDWQWGNEDFVCSLAPDLVIIHRSSFYHPVNALFNFPKDHPYQDPKEEAKFKRIYSICEDKLLLLMAYVARRVPQTHFLIYSRGTDPTWTDDHWRIDVWTKSVETRFPELRDRISTMVVPGGYEKGSFRNKETREMLRSNVIEILKLPKKTN